MISVRGGGAMMTVAASSPRAGLTTLMSIVSAHALASADSGMSWRDLGGDMTMTLSVWRCSGRRRLGWAVCKP